MRYNEKINVRNPSFFLSEERKGIKEMATRAKAVPKTEQPEKAMPEAEVKEKKVPDPEMPTVEFPQVGVPENTIKIGGKLIEIKPMKMKYVRNRTAAFRHILEMYPLSDILAMVQPFGDGRDGDKALFDWLIAVTDDEELIKEHYNDIDTDTIYKLLAIHRRIEKIDELEAKQKNALTPREG